MILTIRRSLAILQRLFQFFIPMLLLFSLSLQTDMAMSSLLAKFSLVFSLLWTIPVTLDVVSLPSVYNKTLPILWNHHDISIHTQCNSYELANPSEMFSENNLCSITYQQHDKSLSPKWVWFRTGKYLYFFPITYFYTFTAVRVWEGRT